MLGRFESLDMLGSTPWMPLDRATEPRRLGELPDPNTVLEFPETPVER